MILQKYCLRRIKIKIKNKFEKAWELKKNANLDVEIGRKYTEAYADYIHFIESLHKLIEDSHHHH